MPIDSALLSDIKFFEFHDEQDRSALARVMDSVFLKEGEMLFENGDPGESLFMVREGKLELFIRNVTGEKIVLTVAERGALFGELAALDTGARTATAVALCESELIVLNRDNLCLFFQKTPDAALDMIAAMGRMIRNADDILRTQVARNVNEEVKEKLTPLQRIAD